MKEKSPNTEIYGVESERCPSFSIAMKQGRPKTITMQSSIADGLAVPKVGYNAVATCLGRLTGMILVSEELLNVAILHILEQEKIIAEGAGASPLAAVLSRKLNHLKGKKVVFIVSGGNIDTSMLGRIIERGLVALGRYVKVCVYVPDKPGGQLELLENVSKLGINVKHILCERAWVKEDDFAVKIKLLCETRDVENAIELKEMLTTTYKKVEFTDFPSYCQVKQLT